MDFLNLPVVMIENVFTYLSYDEIAKNRVVSKAFNEICSRMLNRGFMMIERRHALALKTVKSQLPRRESERRYHPLARHCDILTSIETRISMLNMTYSKYIDSHLCCFIPGKVIDEIRRVLLIVETSKTPPRAHEVLQELRDISSMAIEHFDDKISPAFRKRLQQESTPSPRPNVALAPSQFRSELSSLRRRSILNAKLSLYLANQYKRFYRRMMGYRKMTWYQRKQIRDLITRQREQDATIADLKKRIEECDIKYVELTHTNQAVGGGKAMNDPTTSSGAGGSSLRHFGSQIKLDLSVLPIGTGKRHQGKGQKVLPNMKPRKPIIKLPSLSEDEPTNPEEEPSTSTQKAKTTMAKIRGITSEIRHLSNLSKSIKAENLSKNIKADNLKNIREGKLKRPLGLSAIDVMETEKKKLKKD